MLWLSFLELQTQKSLNVWRLFLAFLGCLNGSDIIRKAQTSRNSRLPPVFIGTDRSLESIRRRSKMELLSPLFKDFKAGSILIKMCDDCIAQSSDGRMVDDIQHGELSSRCVYIEQPNSISSGVRKILR